MISEIILLLASIALILFGANWLTDGSSDLARRMRISALVIGLTVVAFGTSAPELSISLISAIKGANDISLGLKLRSNKREFNHVR